MIFHVICQLKLEIRGHTGPFRLTAWNVDEKQARHHETLASFLPLAKAASVKLLFRPKSKLAE